MSNGLARGRMLFITVTFQPTFARLSLAMPATATKTTTAKDDGSSWISRIAFGLLAFLLMTVVFVYAVLFFGHVAGEEFSPLSFHRRTFVYYEIPLIGMQITPVTYSVTTDDLAKYLVTQKLFPKSTEPAERWDLVLASQGSGDIIDGDAHILTQYLDASNKDGDNIWQKWSKDHAALAKVLWPAVAEVIRNELYSFVPDLFLLARSASTPEQLQQSIDEMLADKYLVVAETLEAVEQKEVAADLFAEVLRHSPDRAEAVRGRERPVDASTSERDGKVSPIDAEADKSE